MTPTYQLLAHSLEDVVANENINALVLKGSPAYGDLTVRPNNMLSIYHKRKEKA